jgi:SAM-dependent methyltransferase
LTPHFVETARALSAMTGMADRVRFEVGSAVALPFPDGSFDLALLLHVGMNVPDKTSLFRETRRVLRDGGTFAIYEVMQTGEGDLAYRFPGRRRLTSPRSRRPRPIWLRPRRQALRLRRRRTGARWRSTFSPGSKRKRRAMHRRR